MTNQDGSSQVVLANIFRIDERGRIAAVDTGNTLRPRAVQTTGDVSRGAGVTERSAETTLAMIGAAFAEELQSILASTGVENVTSLQQELAQGRVVMIELAPTAFLGLSRNRQSIRSLRIDDCLFFFVPPEVRRARMTDLIADLIAQSVPGRGPDAAGGAR